jgi:hypothetical protein
MERVEKLDKNIDPEELEVDCWNKMAGRRWIILFPWWCDKLIHPRIDNCLKTCSEQISPQLLI